MARILIVDDEHDIVEILSMWLEEFGYDSDCVIDVESAIKLLQEKDYFAVFCDLKMPGKSGADLLDYIKEFFPFLVRKFVLITGTIIDEGIETFIHNHGAYILRKPFLMQDMRQIVSSLEVDEHHA